MIAITALTTVANTSRGHYQSVSLFLVTLVGAKSGGPTKVHVWSDPTLCGNKVRSSLHAYPLSGNYQVSSDVFRTSRPSGCMIEI